MSLKDGSPSGQALKQLPQLSRSVVVSTHRPAQQLLLVSQHRPPQQLLASHEGAHANAFPNPPGLGEAMH